MSHPAWQDAACRQHGSCNPGGSHRLPSACRYILTSRGMNAMYEKYKACEFGRCPRVLCNGQPCLPVGTCDVPRQSTVKIFCPKCQDIYYPRSKYQVMHHCSSTVKALMRTVHEETMRVLAKHTWVATRNGIMPLIMLGKVKATKLQPCSKLVSHALPAEQEAASHVP